MENNKNRCKNCGSEIHISIYKGGDWCSDDCRKALGARPDVDVTTHGR